MNNKLIFTVIATLGLQLLSPIAVANPLSADEIMQKVDDVATPTTQVSDLQMILIDKNSNQRVREIRSYRYEDDENKKSAMYFLSPSDVRETAFLTYEYEDGRDDDQWLYLPALKKTKRIASSDKSGSFMGSDFTYSDMSSRELEDYDFKYLKEAKVGEFNVWLIEATPANKSVLEETGYLKSILYVRQDNFVVIRGIHQTDKGLIKLMDLPKLEQIEGYWMPLEMTMTTREGKKSLHKSVIRFNNITVNPDISDDYFSLRQIEKGLSK